ncbi:MAG: hypothetical protein ACOC5G_03870 [Acidobacteriota bacterium]
MIKTKKKKKTHFAKMIVWVGILMVASLSCENPTSPDQESTYATITVGNVCGAALDIYMNGTFQFSVEYLESNVITNLSKGTYELEAKKKNTEMQVSSQTFEISQLFDYIWTVQSSAIITIKNDYGETLSIYTDGEYKDDLKDQNSMLLQNVPFGEHLLEAFKPTDETKVSSTTVNIDENITYTWTISK